MFFQKMLLGFEKFYYFLENLNYLRFSKFTPKLKKKCIFPLKIISTNEKNFMVSNEIFDFVIVKNLQFFQILFWLNMIFYLKTWKYYVFSSKFHLPIILLKKKG